MFKALCGSRVPVGRANSGPKVVPLILTLDLGLAMQIDTGSRKTKSSWKMSIAADLAIY